jgi:hypothetical protein
MANADKVIFLGPNANNISSLAEYTSFIKKNVDESITSIGPISRLNLLVGANNAGKSRFMRALMNESTYVIFDNADALDNYYLFLSKLDSLNAVLQRSNIIINIIRNQNSINAINPEFINKSHKYLFNENFNRQIIIDASFSTLAKNIIEKYLLLLNWLGEL